MAFSMTLEEAVEAAIANSRKAFHSIRLDASSLVRHSEAEIERLGNPDDTDVIKSRFVKAVRTQNAEIQALFSNQATVTGSFNIVLFGRTGSGKSTLIEALTRGDGCRVSQGESDWTTDVQPKIWGPCKVFDTPGINGWGRGNASSELEERARAAVEIADFVVLCFDSQSQQASEFEKVAAWVKRFSKPLIAILNNRNAVWRMPNRVPSGSARANLSATVAQHAVNIQDELASHGMTAVPVVALASKRALFARASLPFEGPDRETLELQRSRYGIDKLEKWSNFPALEKLMVDCIKQHAVSLRVSTLRDQLRGVLTIVCENMDSTEIEAREESILIETQTIEPLLRLLGYPMPETERSLYLREEVDLLGDLEAIRGRFQALSVGEFEVFVQHRLVAELGKLRSKSLVDAEETVAYAFDRGERISSEKLQAKCLSAPHMQDAAHRVLEEAAKFIERRARLVYGDTLADLKARLRSTADIEGDAGTRWKHSAWGMKTSGVLAGGFASLGTVAATNFWNPLGWGAGAAVGVAVIGSIVAGVFGWAGGSARRRAEKKRLAARSEALVSSRRFVHEVYDEYTALAEKEAVKIAVAAAREVVLPALQQALKLRRLVCASSAIASAAREMLDRLPKREDQQRLIWDSKERIEREAEGDRADAAARYWLGESWIENPDGLQSSYKEDRHERTFAYDPAIFASLFVGFGKVWARITNSIEPGSGVRWLAKARLDLANDLCASTVLQELGNIAARGRPRLHLVGDYNAGKSSFIKRLLLDAGQPVPPGLRIRANPTTAEEYIYEWGAVDLVDTPGFQSSQESHTEAARRSFADASAILYLFQPNLITGDDASLRLVLQGDPEKRFVPKARRTFFIVNRSDELGVDPVDNPRRYRELAQRKQRELSEALGSRGIAVNSDEILCMSSDPFGLVGDRKDVGSRSYDEHRDWDGFGAFMHSYLDIETDLLSTGVDRSILEGGLARLAQLDVGCASESNNLRDQSNTIARLIALVSEQKSEGVRLIEDARAKLTRHVEDHVGRLQDEVLSESDPIKLESKVENLRKWWEDRSLKAELERWGKKTQDALERWRARTEEAIDRRLASAEFASAFSDPKVSDAPAGSDNSRGTRWYQDAFNKTGRLAGGATRDVVYNIGKQLGFKFKPWGAVKLARNIGKAGAVMSIIGVSWDVADIFLEERRQTKIEKARTNFAAWMQESCARVVEAVADGDDADSGILRNASKYIALLDAYLTGVKKEKMRNAKEAELLEHTRRTYSDLIEEAERALGGNIWEEV